MQEGPNIARIASLVGERGRAQILMALMSGRALTATELADAAGVTRATASSHLSMLDRARLVTVERQGRHRYFRIADGDVAELVESMMGAAARVSHVAQQFGPRDPQLRKARVCYDHLAGEFGVLIYAGMQARAAFRSDGHELSLTREGWQLLDRLGLKRAAMPRSHRPLCRTCLDWSERRHHLAGALGAALLRRLTELHWVTPLPNSRIVQISPGGERSLLEIFSVR